MCGIVGIYNLNEESVSPNLIKKMTNLIAYRGPDGEGLYVKKNIGLGHRRLSIIDLSKSGHQPMSNTDGSIWIVYNGEIYNYIKLREELEKKGYVFKSNTDTEVIIYSYQEWQEKCLDKFNGMFSFAIWDEKKEQLFCARDRFGIKPFYYFFDGERFVFASEIKSIIKHPKFVVQADKEVLFEYFTFQNTLSYKTLFKDVNIMPPGSYMIVSTEKKIRLKKYWDFNFQENKGIKTEEEYIEELDRLFKQAVKRQLVSDVEIGSYLSGGIDSGSIVAVASKYFANMKTFCIGFDLNSASGIELSFDERKKAEYFSSIYKTEHYEMILKSGDLERCMPELIWHLEDLRLGQSYPNFYASKLSSKFVKVCLSGTGGDELFGGYPWRYYSSLNNINLNNCIEEYYRYWQRLLPNKILVKMFSPIKNEINNVSTFDIFKNVFGNRSIRDENKENCVNNFLYFEAKTFLHGLLVLEDRLGMSQGLETRFPFLDNDLVDFSMKIPVRLKLENLNNYLDYNENELSKKNYYNRTRDGKIILRKALNKYIPDKIINQEKQGFSGPDASWFRGESIEYVKRLLLNKNANIYNYFNYEIVKDLLYEHIKGKQNLRLFIWSLLCFEWWNKIFIEKEDEYFNHI